VPDGVEAITGQDVAAETAASISEAMGFFNTALLVFGLVALFVGAFVIVNTFTIVVAQRSREFALLRAIGATGRQIVRSVLGEAAIVGVIASAAGVGLGVLLAIGLRELLDAFGMSIPSGDLVVQPRTVVLGLAVGLTVTLVSAVLPARRAARIAPLEALRETASPASSSSAARDILGSLLTLTGAGLIGGALGGLIEASPAAFVGAGALAVFVGIGMLAPHLVRPLAGAVGAAPARIGVPGTLARGNAIRTPRRTAATASALMIGLALVSFVAVFAQSLRVSMTAIIEDEIRADFIIAGPNPNFGQGFPPAVTEEVRGLDELGTVSAMRWGMARHEGEQVFPLGIEPETFRQVAQFAIVAGDLADLDASSVAIDERLAEADGLSVGDTYTIEFARTGEQRFPIVAIYENGGMMDGGPVLSLEGYDANFTEKLELYTMATVADGVSIEQARAAVDVVLEDYPTVALQDQTEFREAQLAQVDQLLGLVSALLGMAILIAILGVTNTLALSVFERTREIGLLRAVGMTRGQARAMVRWESVIVSVIGAVMGVGIGIVFGWALVRALGDQGITELAVPGGQLAVFVILAGIAGVLAAIGPARRAAKLDVLEAIATE
jgi:putative ABC transport system permease protein